MPPRVSLQDWNKKDVRRYHISHPTGPPEGSGIQKIQLLSAAVATTPGFEAFLEATGGFEVFYKRLCGLQRKNTRIRPEHQDFMAAALGFPHIPQPSTGYSMDYFCIALRQEAVRHMSARYEALGRIHKEKEASQTMYDAEINSILK